MMTIFDWLTMSAFQQRTAKYIGRREIATLITWMDGYTDACVDGGQPERARTPNGLPVMLLRDYIAMREGSTSDEDIPSILHEAMPDGTEKAIVDRFFAHVNAFMQLSIRCVQHAEAAPDMRLERFVRYGHKVAGLRKISLTEGLCWVILETPVREEYWRCIPKAGESAEQLLYAIGPEEEAERVMRQQLGCVPAWEPCELSCYPKPPIPR